MSESKIKIYLRKVDTPWIKIMGAVGSLQQLSEDKEVSVSLSVIAPDARIEQIKGLCKDIDLDFVVEEL